MSNAPLIEIEQRLLGSILFDPSTFTKIDSLAPDHFSDPLHGEIFAAMAAEIKAGRQVDAPLIACSLHASPALEQVGGLAFLVDLANHGAPYLAADHSAAVRDAATRRELVALASEAGRAGDDPRPAVEVLADLRKRLEGLEESASTGAELVDAGAVASDAVAALEEIAKTGQRRGFRVGLKCVDHRLGGLKPGRLIILGGRPSMGKTALARAIAHGAAVENPRARVLFIGLEMAPDEMVLRELSALTFERAVCSAVEYSKMEGGGLDPNDLATIRDARKHVPANLIFSTKMSAGVDDVRRAIFAAQRKGPLALCVVDYLQLMRRPPGAGRNEASVIAEMTAELKRIARQTGVCLLVLSQLSRQVEGRENKRPGLSDLRESGAIEQDADAVMFVYREAYYLERAKPSSPAEHAEWEHKCEAVRTKLEVICAKARQGAVGIDEQVVRLEYDHVSDSGGA